MLFRSDIFMGGNVRGGGGRGAGALRGVRVRGLHFPISTHIHWNGHTAVKYQRPGMRRPLVRFPPEVIEFKAHVRPTNSRHEIYQAWKQIESSLPANFDRSAWRWHHHWRVGEMQLVPEPFHTKVGHVGRALTWPPEIPVR